MTEGRTRKGQFAAGNSGKPRGARNLTTRAIEELLEGEGEKLTRKAIELALAGDPVALRLCLERLAPVRRERTINFDLPAIKSASDQPAALAAILAGVASGDLTPGEAQALAAVLEQHRRSIETGDLEERIAKLEEAGNADR